MTPPTAQTASTASGEPSSGSKIPVVVNTPVPTMFAITRAVAGAAPIGRPGPFAVEVEDVVELVVVVALKRRRSGRCTSWSRS